MRCPDCGKDALEYQNTVGGTEHYKCSGCGVVVCYTYDQGAQQ